VKTKQSEQEIEVEKHREGMQEIRTMIVSMCNEHNSQMADRAREIVKLRDELEGMKIRASKAERQVDRLLFLVISYVAICASITHYPQLHDSIKQGAQVMPMMHINSAWKGLDGGIRATTGEHNDPENGNNPVLGSAGSTPSSGASTSGASAGTPSIGTNAEIDCFAHTSERLQKQMQEMAKELKQVQATQQRDHAQMRSLMFLMKNCGSEVEVKQQREKQELSNEAEAPPEASRLRRQGIAGRIARTLNSMQQVIAGKRATAERDGGAQREADSTEKQQVKEQLEQHHEQLMDAEQGSEGAQRHTDGAEPKGRMVPEKEADAQTFDDQISEIHTAEHRTATISSSEMVHGQAREPPRQTWRVAAVEGRSRVLVVLVGVLAVVILGGLDSVAGAIIAGLLVGWLESIAVGYFGGKARDLVPYVVVLAILMVRPYGLLGTRNIERL
jgi:hypothetical protein